MLFIFHVMNNKTVKGSAQCTDNEVKQTNRGDEQTMQLNENHCGHTPSTHTLKIQM